MTSFMRNTTWILGPDFLTKPASEWPRNPDHIEDLSTEDPEVKRSAGINALSATEPVDPMQLLIDYFSSWNRLRKAVAWILKTRSRLLLLSKKRRELRAFNAQSAVDADKQ